MNHSTPSFLSALLILSVIFLLFLTGVGIVNYPVELVLIVSTIITAFYARYYGARWQEIVVLFMAKIKDAVPAMLILLAIGMLIGCWIVSGTIPLMVLYGLQMVSPHYLYLTAFLVTVCISMFTGTSWGTAGTIGVALMAVAAAMGVSPAVTAGAVISGSYFGDKLSPLSDTTNMAAMAAGVELWQSIRNMLYTSLPAFVVACVGFWRVGDDLAAVGAAQTGNIDLLGDTLQRLFWLNPLCLLPAALVFFGAARKWDTTVTLMASSFLALAIGAIFQPIATADMAQAAVNGFKNGMLPQFADTARDPAIARNLSVLLNRGGIYSMVSPIVVMLCAFLFASALEASGGLRIVLERLVKKLRSVTSVVLATMFSSALLVACTGNAVISFFLVRSMYDPCYDEHRLHRVNMSRAMESGATLLEGLFPWTISGIFMASTLGVATLDYLPWVFFNLSCFVLALFYACLAKWSAFGTRYIT